MLAEGLMTVLRSRRSLKVLQVLVIVLMVLVFLNLNSIRDVQTYEIVQNTQLSQVTPIIIPEEGKKLVAGRKPASILKNLSTVASSVNEEDSSSKDELEEYDDTSLVAVPTVKLKIKIVSGKSIAALYVGGQLVKSSTEAGKERGMHAYVLNQTNGQLTQYGIFDTYIRGREKDLAAFLDVVPKGRIVCVAIKDEATFYLKEVGRKALASVGSKLAETLQWRDVYTLITQKGVGLIDEEKEAAPDVYSWASNLALSVAFESSHIITEICSWARKKKFRKRTSFCASHDGYPLLCKCNSRIVTDVEPPQITPNNMADVPVVLIARDQPGYLVSQLHSLTNADGAIRSNIVVSFSKYAKDPLTLADIFGVKTIQNNISGGESVMSDHIRMSLDKLFGQFPTAEYAVVIDGDLKISTDIFSYFSQTLPLLRSDDTLYCVSAWNSHGFINSSFDPSLVYRYETPPGLAWMIKRSFFTEVLKSNWPRLDMKLFDWSVWMGKSGLANGRECIVPDVSRVAPFDSPHLHLYMEYPKSLFQKHTITRQSGLVLQDLDKLASKDYDEYVKYLLLHSELLDHSLLPTDFNFVPSTKEKIYSFFIGEDSEDSFTNWIAIAKILKLWYLDPRGHHKGVWRFKRKGNHILCVKCPSHFCKYKPKDVEPIRLWHGSS